MNKRSGDPRKRQALRDAEQAIKSEEARRMALIISREKEIKAEALRLIELFEEQYPDSPGYRYDEQSYVLTISAIAMHRAVCELNDEPEKYDPYGQLDTLELLPAMRKEVDAFLIRNQLDKADSWFVFG